MSLEIKKEKQYVSLTLNVESINSELCEELKDSISYNMESGVKNFIINMKGVKLVEEDFYPSLDTIMNILLKEEGMLVIATCKSGEIKTRIENMGIIALKTMEEAVDYVFMDQLEKQLLSGADEDFDEF